MNYVGEDGVFGCLGVEDKLIADRVSVVVGGGKGGGG